MQKHRSTSPLYKFSSYQHTQMVQPPPPHTLTGTPVLMEAAQAASRWRAASYSRHCLCARHTVTSGQRSDTQPGPAWRGSGPWAQTRDGGSSSWQSCSGEGDELSQPTSCSARVRPRPPSGGGRGWGHGRDQMMNCNTVYIRL